MLKHPSFTPVPKVASARGLHRQPERHCPQRLSLHHLKVQTFKRQRRHWQTESDSVVLCCGTITRPNIGIAGGFCQGGPLQIPSSKSHDSAQGRHQIRCHGSSAPQCSCVYRYGYERPIMNRKKAARPNTTISYRHRHDGRIRPPLHVLAAQPSLAKLRSYPYQ